EVVPSYYSVKEAVFPFNKFPGVDTILGPEMKSTGEVMGVGKTFGEAYLKSQLGSGIRLPRRGRVFMRVRRGDQARAVAIARQLEASGFSLFASTVTATVISAAGIAVAIVEDAETLDMLAKREFALVILTVDEKRSAILASSAIRLAAMKAGTVVYTTIAGADAALEAMRHLDGCELRSLQELHRHVLPAGVALPVRTERIAPRVEDLAAAATVVERRSRPRPPRGGGIPVKLFIRQPFTESDQQQQRLVAEVLQVIDSANGAPYSFHYLTGIRAESATTFKRSFERETCLPFTPQNFRRHRLELLDQADVVVNIRVGMSESSAFELAYHIFQGRRTPILFLVWKQAPIKTTLLRELEDLCDVTYIEFECADDLRRGIHEFFNSKNLGKGYLRLTATSEAAAEEPAGSIVA
ncbi:MAG TPA: carbamoyl phosphate synthase large subunit, partial [Paucimonas sp.]|nr:carbamoyl phosphate synthase large subunit [Paucimonas sp.]